MKTKSKTQSNKCNDVKHQLHNKQNLQVHSINYLSERKVSCCAEDFCTVREKIRHWGLYSWLSATTTPSAYLYFDFFTCSSDWLD